jgi:hypothetical protein
MLISDEYRAEQERMHENERYGAASKKFAPLVAKLIKKHNPTTILDYGAGKCALFGALGDVLAGRRCAAYDPGIALIAQCPDRKFDLVCCIDVLEHVEPECLDSVLADLRAKTGKRAFLTIHTGPAGKHLSDCRNAHLIQQPLVWWVSKLDEHFSAVRARMQTDTTIVAICGV